MSEEKFYPILSFSGNKIKTVQPSCNPKKCGAFTTFADAFFPTDFSMMLLGVVVAEAFDLMIYS